MGKVRSIQDAGTRLMEKMAEVRLSEQKEAERLVDILSDKKCKISKEHKVELLTALLGHQKMYGIYIGLRDAEEAHLTKTKVACTKFLRRLRPSFHKSYMENKLGYMLFLTNHKGVDFIEEYTEGDDS